MFCRRCLPAAAALTIFLFTLCAPAQQTPVPDHSTPPDKPEWTDIPVQPAQNSASPSPAVMPSTNFPSFISCTIPELQRTVHELADLKSSQDQSSLPSLLDKLGAQIAEMANKTPNLISHEAVLTERGRTKDHAEFSFLVLQHPFGLDSHVFDEYRVDVATGKKIETEFADQAPQSSEAPSLLSLPDPQSISGSMGPASQGFFSAWLYFYPTNRSQFEFRYLGQQEMNGHNAQVVAFVQKPALVRLPTMVAFEDRYYQVFMQGIVWVDASDFAIQRLRLELLSVPAAVPLRQFSIDVQFGRISLTELSSPLWLPTQIVTTTSVAKLTLRETHTYRDYRLFRTRSKLVVK